MKSIYIGLILGVILGTIAVWVRAFYAKRHDQKFFTFDKSLTEAGVKKRIRNLYTWMVFGVLIGLVFIIPSLNTDQSHSALIWTYLIGFALIYTSIVVAIILYKQTSK